MVARRIAALLLLLASAHEFLWQLYPLDMQGDVRAITQWPLIAGLCGLVAILARSRLVGAACAAVGLMSTTTSACALAYLISPWVVSSGDEQCSAHWGVPMLLVSGLAAVLVLIWWPHDPEH